MRSRFFPHASVVLLLALGSLHVGCDKEGGVKPDAQVEALQVSAELDRTKKKLAATEKEMSAKEDAAVLAKEEMDRAGAQLADKDKAIAERDAQVKVLEGEIADLKKRDAFVFAEISKLNQQGVKITALDRYRQFVTTFPKSPLVADANRAIAELTVTVPRDARARIAAVDPHAAEREFQKKFGDGIATLEDVAPMLKKKSLVEVVRLLGSPNRTYRDGTELGYVDRVIDPATGSHETLVIGFEDGQVSTLRVGYQGRAIRP